MNEKDDRRLDDISQNPMVTLRIFQVFNIFVLMNFDQITQRIHLYFHMLSFCTYLTYCHKKTTLTIF